MKCKKCKQEMEFYRPVFESSNLEDLSYFWCDKCKVRINYCDAELGVNE